MISIVDYGMGNLRSVEKAFERIEYSAEVIDDPARVSDTSLLVVPGVGAFDEAVKNLREDEFWNPVLNHIESGTAYLGICLGLQLLFEGSDEGSKSGFGILRGTVQKFTDISPVPHMGWNEVEWVGPGEELQPDIKRDPSYYFVHSYYPAPVNDDVIAGRTQYGTRFCAAIRDENCFGVQFHPEKSQQAGLNLLQRICELTVGDKHSVTN